GDINVTGVTSISNAGVLSSGKHLSIAGTTSGALAITGPTDVNGNATAGVLIGTLGVNFSKATAVSLNQLQVSGPVGGSDGTVGSISILTTDANNGIKLSSLSTGSGSATIQVEGGNIEVLASAVISVSQGDLILRNDNLSGHIMIDDRAVLNAV